MKNLRRFLTLAVAFLPLGAFAQSTYTTTNGTVNLVAGLTNLTSATAINTTNQAVGISYITDSSWSTTGVLNLGYYGGTLAGTFGGGTYFGASNSIILIGSQWLGTNVPQWGKWTVRMLLSDDTYSSAISFTNSDLTLNLAVTPDGSASYYQNLNGTTNTPGPGFFGTVYQELSIAAFDTGNIGVKGIELSDMYTSSFAGPDISYIGVTGAAGPGPQPVPEPGTWAAAALLLGTAGYVRWRKREKVS